MHTGLATQITGIGGTIGMVWSFGLVPLIKPLSLKLGKRAALIMGAGIAFMAALAQPFILNPAHPYLLLIPALAVSPLVTIAYTLGNAIVPDICDEDELLTGQRREGLFTSVMGFMAKMEISLCTLVVGYLVTFSGLNVKLAVQPEWVLHNLYWMAIVPNIFFTLVTLLLTLRFPMTAASMAEVRRQLDARHQARPDLALDNEVADREVEAWAQAGK